MQGLSRSINPTSLRITAQATRHRSQRRYSVKVLSSVDTNTSSSNGTQPIPGATGIVTDSAVPEGHQGLHTFLYGEGGAEAHDTSSKYNFREGEDDGSSHLDVTYYLANREGEKPFGVYAIYDQKNNLQYVGYSRNVVLAVKVVYYFPCFSFAIQKKRKAVVSILCILYICRLTCNVLAKNVATEYVSWYSPTVPCKVGQLFNKKPIIGLQKQEQLHPVSFCFSTAFIFFRQIHVP